MVVDRNIAPADRALVGALVQFLWSEPAQRLFVRRGFRSVDERLNAANPAFGRIRIRSGSPTSAAGSGPKRRSWMASGETG